MPTEGDIVNFDLEQVSLDLSTVPLIDVLEFREQYGSDYRAYHGVGKVAFWAVLLS